MAMLKFSTANYLRTSVTPTRIKHPAKRKKFAEENLTSVLEATTAAYYGDGGRHGWAGHRHHVGEGRGGKRGRQRARSGPCAARSAHAVRRMFRARHRPGLADGVVAALRCGARGREVRGAERGSDGAVAGRGGSRAAAARARPACMATCGANAWPLETSQPGDSGELLGFLAWQAGISPTPHGFWPAQAVANHALCGVGAIDSSTAMTAHPLHDYTDWDQPREGSGRVRRTVADDRVRLRAGGRVSAGVPPRARSSGRAPSTRSANSLSRVPTPRATCSCCAARR